MGLNESIATSGIIFFFFSISSSRCKREFSAGSIRWDTATLGIIFSYPAGANQKGQWHLRGFSSGSIQWEGIVCGDEYFHLL